MRIPLNTLLITNQITFRLVFCQQKCNFAFQPRIKLREKAHKKLYWFDAGVARAASRLLHDPADRAWLGFSAEKHRDIFYYPSGENQEIDFLIETKNAAPGAESQNPRGKNDRGLHRRATLHL